MSILMLSSVVFLFKQKTAYELRICDWSSDVCSSDLDEPAPAAPAETPSASAPSSGISIDGLDAAHSALADTLRSQASWTRSEAEEVAGTQIGRPSCRERVCPYG